MKAITLKLHFIVLITLLTQTLNAQCSSGCNLTITVPNNNTYNLTAGQTVCITGSGTFTGRLNNFNGNTLCIGTGVNYNPSTAPNYNGNWTIINHGTFTKTTNLNFNSGTSFTNAATGTISLGSINIGSSTTFNNYGTLSVTALTVNSGGSVTLGGTTNSSGLISNNGSLNITGALNTVGITNNSGGAITASATIVSTAGIINNGTFNTTANVTATTFTNNSGSNFTINGALALTGLLSNSSTMNITGSLTGTAVTNFSGGNLSINGNASITGTLTNTGTLTQQGSFNTAIILNNSGGVILGGSSTSCNYISASGAFTNNGTIGGSGHAIVVGNTPIGTGSILSPATTSLSTPTVQPTALNLSFNGTSVNGSFTQASNATAGGYIILRATSTTTSAPGTTNPTNYTNYSIGQTLGSWTIVALNNGRSNTTFTDDVSTLCNYIHYRILSYALSGNCRVYRTSSALTNYVDIRPSITGTTPGTIIGAGTVTLGATANYGTVNWYANSSGGSILGTGTTFTTPSISTSTNYYAEAANGTCVSATRTLVIATVDYPEIDIRGNNVAIGNGDATPSTSDFTFIGSNDVAVGSISKTFQLRNLSSTAPLTIGTISFSGANASDFSIGTPPATTVAANSSTTFTIVFNPSATGTRNAIISIVNNDQNENPYTFSIQGTGITDIDGDGIDVSVDTDDDNDGISDLSECRTCTTDPFQNGSFETPVIGASTYSFVPTASVTGWQTSAENVIEIWSSGFNGVNAAAGNQFAELNANVPGVLYQTFCLNGAGGTITYSVRHRGRVGTDTAYMKIGNSLANALASTPVQTLTDGNSAWGLYAGTYTIPTGMRQIVITFQAGPTATGDQSVGNFIDDIQITINQSCVDTDADGVADISDLDSDNDGTPDIEEAGFKAYSNQSSTMDKTNASLWADANANGLNDYIEATLAAPSYTVLNSDGDVVPNYIDLDSDNDSLFDIDEAGLLIGDGDVNGDGKGDYLDADGDGIMNIHDNYTGYGTNGKAYAQDTDNDGTADVLDLDSNNDGINDVATGLFAALDTDNNGRINGTADADEDGLLDTFDTNTSVTGSPRNLDQKLYLNFDGRNDYAEDSPILGGLSNATLMAWIDLAPTFASDGIVMGQSNFHIKVNSSRALQVVINGTTFTYTNTAALSRSKWYHVAATYGGGSLTIYLNGDPQTFSVSGAISADTSNFTLGKNPTNTNTYFNGKMDEVRVFNVSMSDTKVQRMINQEIQSNGAQVRGTFIPKDIESLPYANLIRYYRMDAFKDDIADNFVSPGIDTGTGLKIYNHKVIATQEAPMPYVTVRTGDFATAITDTTKDIDGADVLNFDWNIIDVRHNITETSNSTDLAMVINSGVRVTMNNDTKMQNAWYLKLDGVLDLAGRSQLIQTNSSDLEVTSAGSIERDQQGTKNIYNYNYWSSPVAAINTTTNNGAFTVAGVVKDGTTSTPQNITWTSGLDGAATSPITLSSYWIFKFQNLTNTYANWQSVGQNGALYPAQGFTLKGSGATGPNQNLTFVGKPNNGTVTTTVAPSNLNLTGNPYPSAIDANLFINANTSSITGSLYFWEHAANNNSHNLSAYQGGYSVRNLVGGVGPSAPAGINGVGNSSRVPQRYIPVGQGFFVVGNSTGGTITFTNGQRTFIKETNASSNALFKNANATTSYLGNNEEDPIANDQYIRVRLGMTSKDNYHRNILLGFMENLATPALDYGFDAVSIDNQPNDVYFKTAGTNLAIQGDDYFNVNKMYPIGVKAYITGEIKFMIDEVENLPAAQRYYILDNQDGVFHDITNNPYIVEVPQGNTDNRFVLTFKDTTALNNTDFNNENSIQVVYTSTNDVLTIKNNVADATIHKVILYNMLGQEVMTFKVNGQDQSHIEIPVNGISSGTYITKVVSDKGTTSKKIVFN
ncbi:LamG-like jellyroll fold domain-containing protein [Flavobacterium stagni]|nr:LamG-like jellyroll fold domain-containing protein [Flavobacterium stagni]